MSDQLNFPEQHQANLDELRILNPPQKKTGYIALSKEQDGFWHQSTALPTHMLYDEEYLPGLKQWVESTFNENSYFCINDFWRPGSTYSPEAKDGYIVDPITGRFLLRPKRDKEWLKNLNANYVDLDYYKLNLTKGAVVGQIIDATEAGKIPMPTLLRDSGRGLWIVWALDNCRAFEPKRELWRATQRRLHEIFNQLGSDPKSLDIVRNTRLLGSLNTKSNTRVSMMLLADNNGNLPRYKLKSLADQIGVVFGKQKRVKNPNAKPENVAKGIKGQSARWVHDEARFWELVAIRGNIPEGIRNASILVCGAILKHRYYGSALTAELASAAKRLFEAFETKDGYTLEPLPKTKRLPDGKKLDSVTTQLHSAAKMKQDAEGNLERIPHHQIAKYLEITPVESAQLQERTGRAAWPPSSIHDQPVKLPNQRDKKRLRQAYIKQNWSLVSNLDNLQLAELLGERGLQCDQSTAQRDRKAVAKQIANESGQARIAFTDPAAPQETKGTESQNS